MIELCRDVVIKLLLILTIVIVLLLLIYCMAGYGRVFETADLEDYGIIQGNFDNETPADFIHSFFPETIEDSFTDVVYHYKAKKGDTYAFEAYLELTIEDSDTFLKFVDKYVDQTKCVSFRYDNSFMDYTVSNILDLVLYPARDEVYTIDSARIGKILFSPADNRIIFFALGMYDGGGADTSELNYFFNRFGIDVVDYQLNAYWSIEDQINGILYSERYANSMPTAYPYPE